MLWYGFMTNCDGPLSFLRLVLQFAVFTVHTDHAQTTYFFRLRSSFSSPFRELSLLSFFRICVSWTITGQPRNSIVICRVEQLNNLRTMWFSPSVSAGTLVFWHQLSYFWVGCIPTQSPPRCTKCNSLRISGQCTNFILFNVALCLCPLRGKTRLYSERANLHQRQNFNQKWSGIKIRIGGLPD